MKRKTKNIISIILLIVLICSIVFTGYLYHKSLNNSQDVNATEVGGNAPDMSSANGNSQTPPDMPSGDNSNGSTPSMPSGDNSNESASSMPSGDNSSSSTNTPPEKPEGDSTTDSDSDEEDSADSEDTTQVAMPNGDNNSSMPSMPNNDNANSVSSNESSTDYTYVIILCVESLLLSCVVMYLILSGFNKKSIKETLVNADKKVILVLGSVVLTLALTFGINTLVKHITNENVSGTEETTNTNSNNNGTSQTTNVTYSSANEITEDTTVDSGEYSSETADENAISVSGDIDVTMSNIEVTKTGDSDGGDSTSFYGINSAIIAKDGATLTLKDITVTTDATGANGVFSYGGSATTSNSSSDGTTVNISDSTITTKKDNSGGIMTTGGGITNATNLTVTTAGTSSAAIRTDRGGGTVNVNGGTYKTTGQGSPTIYSTAEILVKNATLTATTSEGIVVEGKNSVTIEDTTLTDSNTKLNGQSTTYKNIFLYQSMSGDADDGVSSFTAKNSKITTNNGDTIYVTNTTAEITLTNNEIINNDEDGNFLRVQKDSWGNEGSNGGDVTLTLNNQSVTGNIVVDSISTLDMTMKNGSYYEGTINGDNTAKSITLTLDKKSSIKLTGDTYVTSLDDADSTYSNIDFNGYTLYVNGVAIN